MGVHRFRRDAQHRGRGSIPQHPPIFYIMNLYTVNYINPRTNNSQTIFVYGLDKTDARDIFFEMYKDVMYVERIKLFSY